MSDADAKDIATDPFDEESKHLSFVLEKVFEQLGKDGMTVFEADEDEDADEALTADEIADATVEALQRERRKNLRVAAREPYFGRLDFSQFGTQPREKLYIGKRGIDDPETADRLVLDWRSPAASMFYSFTGQGNRAEYLSPDGVVEGTVWLKRNIVVREGELQRVVDSYVDGEDKNAVTDEFLLYRLGENKDSRLRDIVSTIQFEQNEIIRADRGLPVVIQGVAGSGKTTVALHRLAYLLYQHQDRLRADRMVIFAPTAMFVDYISEVLPELGVGGIQQTTFNSWAMRLLDFKVGLQDQGQRLRDWFGLQNGAEKQAAYEQTSQKGRLDTLKSLETFLHAFERRIVPHEDFTPWDGYVICAQTISEWFHRDYAHYPVAVRVERTLARVKRAIDIALKDVDATEQKDLKKTSTKTFRQYEKSWPNMDVLAVYRDFLANSSNLSSDSIRMPKKHGARPEVQSEDLALLLFIHQMFHGIDARDRFDHVVIDEAQDFSPVQISVLRAYCQSQSFTILGDLSQSIHTYQGIANWDDFIEQFPEKCAYYQLDVSYRSTLEIIEFANEIIRPFEGFIEAKPVFRGGDPVEVRQVEWRDRLDAAVDHVNELKQTANTVALLTRTEESARVYHLACLEAGLDAHLIDATQTEYRGGISVVPVYLAKGLEFDSVLLVDVDAEHYEATPLSAKLLYVGCTRVLS